MVSGSMRRFGGTGWRVTTVPPAAGVAVILSGAGMPRLMTSGACRVTSGRRRAARASTTTAATSATVRSATASIGISSALRARTARATTARGAGLNGKTRW